MSGVDAVAGAVASLAAEPADGLTSVDLQRLLVLANRVQAEVTRRVAGFDRAGLSVDDGCRSTAGWLRAFARMSGPGAAALVHRARLCVQLPAATADTEARPA